MRFRIHCNIQHCNNIEKNSNLVTVDKLQQSVSTEINDRNLVTVDKLQQSVSTEINDRNLVTVNKLQQSVSTEINDRNLVTANQLQQSVSTEINDRNLVTANQLQQSVSTEIENRMLVTIEKLQQSVYTEIDSRMLITIDQLNERLQLFSSNPQSEINKIKIIDISQHSIKTFYLKNEDEFVVLVNNNQNNTNEITTVYLPIINIVGIEITIVNLSGNDSSIKTLVEDINNIDNGDYFYDCDNPLQSSILLCSNYSLRFISYMENKWVNIV